MTSIILCACCESESGFRVESDMTLTATVSTIQIHYLVTDTIQTDTHTDSDIDSVSGRDSVIHSTD